MALWEYRPQLALTSKAAGCCDAVSTILLRVLSNFGNSGTPSPVMHGFDPDNSKCYRAVLFVHVHAICLTWMLMFPCSL